MNKLVLALTAASAVAVAVPAAAQNWQPIGQRQANLYNRIEQGVANGSLTRGEANSLRRQFVNLERMDDRYARGGYSRYEVADLQRRYDQLSARVYNKKHNMKDRRW
ncbi:hypothetical protein HMF7854_13290 [Sphingomonas ginkgonis]|uniref:DUF4148 domain-containing protein n=1 Tax=Sphingomonas ginkgonis TaxID=2315330 RepID=A0A429VCY3_9SPHN|nr:hypothetical protein [Sphingomonas ginkgonis]RST31702.1 hypothetical protein HMF7854_13290 [Sphingomonas ginkgonis]